MAITPFMQLDLPTVSTTLGPEWASLLIAAQNLIDSHDHSTDHGAKVTPAGLTINSDLSFEQFQATNLKAVQLYAQASTLAASFIGVVYRYNNDLYYNNSAGTPIQITSGSAVVSPGSGVLTVGSTVTTTPFAVTTAYAQTVIPVDTSALAITLTLPAASSTGLTVVIKDKTGTASAFPITITPNGADTIDNVASSYLLNFDHGSFTLISDAASNWAVI